MTITYDGIGNPLSYNNGSSYTFSWYGRDLDSVVYNGKTMSFSYNDEGVRTSKTVNGVTTTYYVEGSKVIAEETNGNVIIYIYDSDGMPLGMQYHSMYYSEDSWDIYWYERNLQGDIVAVYSSSGIKLISYSYDAWGNFTTAYHNTGENSTAVKNPFKYRGYYYDSDLNLYYLNTRYYDPVIGRFISPDSEATITASLNALTDKNLYAYCDNNPVMRTDNGGMFWDTFFDVVSLATSIVDVIQNPSDPWAWAGLVGDAVDVLVPGLSGVGEVTDVIRVANKADNAHDTVKATKKTLSSIKKASKKLSKGDNCVYISKGSNKIIEYVGITNDFGRREAEWAKKGREIHHYIDGVDRKSARILEQTVIESFDMRKNGGLLTNKINSISKRNPLYQSVINFKNTIK